MIRLQNQEITQLLLAWNEGDQGALDKLVPLVYQELHRLAHRYIVREQHNNTIQTTALLHEAYLRLIDQRDVHWQNRSHFFAISAQIMRRILVDFARARQCQKRGPGQQLALDDALYVGRDCTPDLVALDDALNTLATIDARKSQIVEMRFFAGMSVAETAAVLKVSVDTVMRDWRLAKSWLLRELTRH